MAAVIYAYGGCDTCRKAVVWLKGKGVEPEVKAIRETPPVAGLILEALRQAGGDRRKVMNTSGGDYREAGMKERLEGMTDVEWADFLATRGNLIKRPFLVVGDRICCGFRPEVWEKIF